MKKILILSMLIITLSSCLDNSIKTLEEKNEKSKNIVKEIKDEASKNDNNLENKIVKKYEDKKVVNKGLIKLNKNELKIFNLLVDKIDTSKFRDIVKTIKREERKNVCEKIIIVNKEKDPIKAFAGAECLLYNGFPERAIPLFAEYIYGEKNKKYFNGRIGYGWLHSADWYNVGGDILGKMTGEKDLYSWVLNEVYEEVYSNINKYKNSNKDILYYIFKTKAKNLGGNLFSKLSEKDKKLMEKSKNCLNIENNIDGIKCNIVSTKEINDCKKNFNGNVKKFMADNCEKLLDENSKKIPSCVIDKSEKNKGHIKCLDLGKENIFIKFNIN